MPSACNNPAGGSNPTTGTITLEKYNKITTVDSGGKGGMTTAQVVAIMGFDGERSETVFSGRIIISHTFRESPTKWISVNFNKDDRATAKGLYGITFLTLEKYQAITVDATAGGMTLDQVNAGLGIDGTVLNRATGLTNYTWV